MQMKSLDLTNYGVNEEHGHINCGKRKAWNNKEMLKTQQQGRKQKSGVQVVAWAPLKF